MELGGRCRQALFGGLVALSDGQVQGEVGLHAGMVRLVLVMQSLVGAFRQPAFKGHVPGMARYITKFIKRKLDKYRAAIE